MNEQHEDHSDTSADERSDAAFGKNEVTGASDRVPSFYELSKAAADEGDRSQIETTIAIADRIGQLGGRVLVVGGFVRDTVLKQIGHDVEPKDIDLEVYDIDPKELEEMLRPFGKPNVVGEQFCVIKINDLDIAIPRRDSKTGEGHTGFTVSGDPSMNFKEAAARRDFTLNALGMDPLTGELLDEHGGVSDIQAGVLRMVDEKTFADDSLRVLRAMQFAGRFGFSVEERTQEVCRGISLNDLKVERIGEEWVKLLMKSPRPSIGLETARQLQILEKLHPELAALSGVPQDPKWHPEGDVWTHIKIVADRVAEITKKEKIIGSDKFVQMLLALCHDLGKPFTTVADEQGHITAYGHAEAGIEPALKFLRSINIPAKIVERVVPLVREHMFPKISHDVTDKTIRRLAKRLQPASIRELFFVDWADRGSPESRGLLERAEQLDTAERAPTPLLRGRDLIRLGFKPGPAFNSMLSQLYDAQLEGDISTHEEAESLARRLFPLT